MTTAFWLTNVPNWQDQYEVTVYQVGWRLGGKGAAGRGDHDRIEEHGLHIWIGFYDNAFRMIQAAYAELNRPPGSPLATWQEAFTPHNYIVLEETKGDSWSNWPFDFPTNPRVPGDPGEFLTIWDYIIEALQILFDAITDHVCQPSAPAPHESALERAVLEVEAKVLDECKSFEDYAMGDVFHTILDRTAKLRDQARAGAHGDHADLDALMERAHNWIKIRPKAENESDDVRRLFILADLGFAMAKGILHDIVDNEAKGYDEIDRFDFRDWLTSYGADQEAIWSAPLKGLYDLVFGYENGEIVKPNFAAGAALRSVLRITLDYKGSIFWKMNAGMGDTIFGPLYLVLKNRGVQFEFFNRVENLGLSEDRSSIETITIGQQVTLKDGYDPLFDVKGLPCWPDCPLYDQIVEGEQLKAENINLESFWTPWKNIATKTLKCGEDFDEVVLGISIGAFPYLCSELIAASPKWAAMCKDVQTVRTMSMQWWMKPDLAELGWSLQSPVMDAYVDPMNTWADMTFLLPTENWPVGEGPKQLSYFCGAMVGGIPPQTETSFPAEALAEVKQVGLDFATQNSGYLWPLATPPDNPNGTRLDLFQDGFDSQYFRANVDPSERYVLSLKGSTASRLKPSNSGFPNLYLTGDWTYNYFNAGCVEATVMSGMLCANAMTGVPPLCDIEGVPTGEA